MRLVIDTDLGMGTAGADPEDGLAILYALRSPEATLEGITLVHGNVPVAHSWPNARRLLELVGRPDIPLHAGARGPRDPPAPAPPGDVARGSRGPARCGSGRRTATADTAADFLREIVVGSPGEVTLVAIGPLTNVAAAIESDPDFAGALAGLVVMGGTVAVPGNITPAAEFNIWMDPEAASIVFDSGAPVTMVRPRRLPPHPPRPRPGLSRVRRARHSATSWPGPATRGSTSAPGSSRTTKPSTSTTPSLSPRRSPPTSSTAGEALVEVETSAGPAQGMTVTHLNAALRRLLTGRDANARVATGVDTGRFEALFADRVMAGL